MEKQKSEENVISFPEQRSVKVRIFEKKQSKRSALGISIFSVLVFTIFINQWIQRQSEGQQELASRGVASLQPINNKASIQWEHELAKALSDEKAVLGDTVATKPDLKEELIFGYLEGKYGVRVTQGKIESLEFINAQAGEVPLQIASRDEFLLKYKNVFSLGYNQVRVLPKVQGDSVESYNLISEGNVIVGKAEFRLDESGRTVSLKFEK